MSVISLTPMFRTRYISVYASNTNMGRTFEKISPVRQRKAVAAFDLFLELLQAVEESDHCLVELGVPQETEAAWPVQRQFLRKHAKRSGYLNAQNVFQRLTWGQLRHKPGNRIATKTSSQKSTFIICFINDFRSWGVINRESILRWSSAALDWNEVRNFSRRVYELQLSVPSGSENPFLRSIIYLMRKTITEGTARTPLVPDTAFIPLRHFGHLSEIASKLCAVFFVFGYFLYDWKTQFNLFDFTFFGHFKKIRSMTEKKQVWCTDSKSLWHPSTQKLKQGSATCGSFAPLKWLSLDLKKLGI